jgi:hypothetical protein
MASKHSKRSASMSMNVYGSSLGCPKKEGTDIPKLTNPYIQYPSSTDVLNNQPRFPLSSRDFCAHPPNITFLESVVKKKNRPKYPLAIQHNSGKPSCFENGTSSTYEPWLRVLPSLSFRLCDVKLLKLLMSSLAFRMEVPAGAAWYPHMSGNRIFITP